MKTEAALPNAAHVKVVGTDMHSEKTEALQILNPTMPRTQSCSSTMDVDAWSFSLASSVTSPPIALLPY